jgi:hypothetical protein
VLLRAPCPGWGFSVGPVAVGFIQQVASAPVIDGALLTASRRVLVDPYTGVFTGACIRLGRWPVLLPEDVDLKGRGYPRTFSLVLARRGMGHSFRTSLTANKRAARRVDQVKALYRARSDSDYA